MLDGNPVIHVNACEEVSSARMPDIGIHAALDDTLRSTIYLQIAAIIFFGLRVLMKSEAVHVATIYLDLSRIFLILISSLFFSPFNDFKSSVASNFKKSPIRFKSSLMFVILHFPFL